MKHSPAQCAGKGIVIHGKCRLIALFCLVAIVGCDRSSLSIVPVSGRVTLDGRPLVGGSVNFQPIAAEGQTTAGRGSFAYCDAEGIFSLETTDGQDGAVIADHRVRIYGPRQKQDSSIDGGAPNVEHREIVPSQYNYETTLIFTVPAGGTEEAVFDLTTDK